MTSTRSETRADRTTGKSGAGSRGEAAAGAGPAERRPAGRPARRPGPGARAVRGAPVAQPAQPPGRAADVPPRTFTLDRAREEVGLPFAEFELALQLGEIATVPGGGERPRVSAEEIARVRDQDGGTAALLSRIELVNSTAAAGLLGIGRDRLLRLTRAGLVLPVRWYVNRYRALVWLYLAGELRELAVARPSLLAGRLPAELREAEAEGVDLRPRGWRSRQVARLVKDAPGPWEEAAVWAALLGPEVTDAAVPDPRERRRLRAIHTVLPYGRPGPLAGAALIRRLTVADAPDEVATGLLALSEALGRARGADRAAPRPPHRPGSTPPERRAALAPGPGEVAVPRPEPVRVLRPAPGAARAPLPDPLSGPGPGGASAVPAPAGAPAGRVGGAAPPAGAPRPAAAAWAVGERPRRSLLRLLRGRRHAVEG
ncbi:DUF6397 family protein [Streptomyces sp. NPDC020983]|uniref:DUF6397 family protein n=1 Tax=Streptomyces sp. NPDC020983 TaxID=3365106 RepID=UPI0037B094CB